MAFNISGTSAALACASRIPELRALLCHPALSNCVLSPVNPKPEPSTADLIRKRRSKGAKEVFGRGQSLAPETEQRGLCSIPS